MSKRAMAYDDEPLVHRVLVLYEAHAIASETGNYLLRSLLSEGLVRYLTVEKTSEGIKPKKRQVQQYIRGRNVSAREFNAALRNLEHAGEVLVDSETTCMEVLIDC